MQGASIAKVYVVANLSMVWCKSGTYKSPASTCLLHFVLKDAIRKQQKQAETKLFLFIIIILVCLPHKASKFAVYYFY